MKISVIQLNSQANVAENLARTLEAMTLAVDTDNPDLIALPEYALCLTGDRDTARRNAQNLDDSEPLRALASFGEQRQTAIHLGSVVEKTPEDRYYNTSIIFDRSGTQISKYRKINLFETTQSEWCNSVVHNEAGFLSHGDTPTMFDLQGITFGNSICYDLRFSALYKNLRSLGASVFFAPAAFTAMTGKRDWENLLRARAVETGCHIVAANQCGTFDGGQYESWGHSMIVDPSGATEVCICPFENSIVCQSNLYLASKIEKTGDAEARENLRCMNAAHTPMA